MHHRTPLLAIAIAAALAAPSLAADPARPTQIVVYGTGHSSQTPRQAVVNLAINTNDAVAANATRANNDIYNAMVAQLAPLGVGAADVKFIGFNLNFVPPPPKGTPAYSRSGYYVNRSVAITVHDFNNVGKVVDACVAAGVTNVYNVSFGLGDASAPQRDAYAHAVADARAQGEALARAAGLRIIRIASIQQGYAPIAPRTEITRIMTMASGIPVPQPPTALQPSNIEVTANVTVVFDAVP